MKITYNAIRDKVCFLFLLLITLILFSNQLIAQTGTITQVTADDLKINICEANLIEISISNVSGTVDFDLNIPTELEVLTAKSNGTQLAVTTTNWQIPSSSNLATLELELRPKCENYNLGNPTITGQINGNSFSRTYEIIKGDLSYINMTYSPNNGVVDIGEIVTRCFEYKNTSDTTFSGRVVFVDTLEKAYDGSWIDFLGVEITNNGGGTIQIIEQTETDSSAILIFSIEDLPAESSLIICDSVRLNTCTPTNQLNRGRTLYSLDYGCKNELTTCVQTPIGTQITNTTRINKNPIIAYERLNETRTCQANEDRHIYRIWNRGTGVAQGFDFQYSTHFDNNTPYDITKMDLDSANIELYYLDANGNKIDIDFYTDAFGSNEYGPYRCTYCSYIRTKELLINPNDTIYLEFTERQTCPLDEEAFFPNKVTMQNERFRGIFRHDCKPDTRSFVNFQDGRYPLFQQFSLSQNIPNLTATISDQQVVDFDINNLNQLWLGYPSDRFPVYFFDTSTFRLELELELTPGLCLQDIDSIGLYSVVKDSLILPISYEIIGEAEPCTHALCGGAKVRFRFQLPAHFYTTRWNSQWGILNVFSQDYMDFFSNFKVQFSVKGECDCSDGSGEAEVNQKFYAIYDTTCTDQCRIPINQVGDRMTLNCPGCIVPGWNLLSMNLQRQNIDMADTDDNHFPDSYPMQMANISDVRTDRIMIGDRVGINIIAETSDGVPSMGGYTFSGSGFDYLFGQFSLQGSLVEELELVEIQGTFDDQVNPPYIFNINGNTLSNLTHQNGDLLLLDLDVADWATILGNNNFTKYNDNQRITLDFIFDVTGNLTNSGGLPPFMGRYDVVGRFHISGTDFSNTVLDGEAGGGFKFDALNSFPNSKFPTATEVKDVPNPERDSFFYWCTHWESRITGIGIVNQFSANGIDGNQNICIKQLRTGFTGITGQSIQDFKNNNYPSTYNAFPFELRNIWMMDSITIDLPSDYYVHRLLLNNGATYKQNGVSQRVPTPHPNHNNLQVKEFTIPDNLITTYNNTITFHLHEFLEKVRTSPDIPNAGFDNDAYQLFHSFYGENKGINLIVELMPDDCRTPVDEVVSLDAKIYLKNDPFNQRQDSTYSRTFNFNKDLPIATFEADILNVTVGANGNDLTFDTKIFTRGINTYHFAPNTFIYFASSTGGITIQSINNAPNAPFSLLNNGEKIFHMKDVQSRWAKEPSFTASYDCSKVNGVDTIMMIVGYGCEGFVTDLNDACRLDTFYIPIAYQSPGLNATHSLNVSNSTCDTANYSITFDATGTINVENVIAEVTFPQGASLISNTGVLLFNNQQFNVVTNSTANPYIFEMTDLVDFSGRDAALTSATLSLPVLFTCDYDNGMIQTKIKADDFCGKALPIINLISPIAENLQKVDFSNVVLSDFEYQLITDCESPANYVITIQNNNNATSGNFQIDYYCTADNNGNLSPRCLIGSSNTLNLAANSQQIITTNLTANCPNCTQIEAVLKSLEDCVCEQNTQNLIAIPNCDSCELIADFSYVTTENCALEIRNNTIGDNLNYLWHIKDINGNVVSTSTLKNPIFSQLTTPDFTLCLIVTDAENPSCKDELCKDISMCCVDNMPCDLDGEIKMTFDEKSCEHFFTVNTNVIGSVTYSWQITAPNGSIQTFTNNTDNITFLANQSGLHQVQVIAIWLQGNKECSDTLTQSFRLRTCQPDCTFEGQLELKNTENCEYILFIDNGIANANYVWNVTSPSGNAVSAISTANTTFTFLPQETGIYSATVYVSWTIDGFECFDTLNLSICLEACEKPCEYDGRIIVDFNDKECLFNFSLSNLNLIPNASIAWSVLDPNNNSVNYQTGINGIEFSPQITGMYQVKVRVTWQDGDEKCEKIIKLNRNLAACKTPCEFEGEITLKEADCELMAFVADAPTNVDFTWQIVDANNQAISNTPNQNFTMFQIPNDGVYTIEVKMMWQDGNEKCEKVLILQRCLNVCK